MTNYKENKLQCKIMHPLVAAFIGIGLRIFTFICLLIALVVIATDKVSLIDGFKINFNDIHGYRYVLSVAVIGLAYTILELVLSIYYAVTQHTPFWNGLPQFNYYADQVITWVLATAAGAGFGVSAELKRLFHQIIETEFGDYELLFPALDQQTSLVDDFFDKANISSAILFLAFLSMASLVILSPFTRPKSPPKAQDLEARKLKAQSPPAQSVQPQSPPAQNVEPHSPPAQSPPAQALELSST